MKVTKGEVIFSSILGAILFVLSPLNFFLAFRSLVIAIFLAWIIAHLFQPKYYKKTRKVIHIMGNVIVIGMLGIFISLVVLSNLLGNRFHSLRPIQWVYSLLSIRLIDAFLSLPTGVIIIIFLLLIGGISIGMAWSLLDIFKKKE